MKFDLIDCILKNPAPSTVPYSRVVSMIGDFFKNTFGLTPIVTDKKFKVAGRAFFAPEQ